MCPCHNQILGHRQHTQAGSVGQLSATDPPWEVVSAPMQSWGVSAEALQGCARTSHSLQAEESKAIWLLTHQHHPPTAFNFPGPPPSLQEQHSWGAESDPVLDPEIWLKTSPWSKIRWVTGLFTAMAGQDQPPSTWGWWIRINPVCLEVRMGRERLCLLQIPSTKAPVLPWCESSCKQKPWWTLQTHPSREVLPFY